MSDVVVMRSTAHALDLRLGGVALDADQVELIREYLQTWIDDPQWDNLADIAELRRDIQAIGTDAELEAYIVRVTAVNASPFEWRA